MSVNITATSLLCSPLIFSIPSLPGCFLSISRNQRTLDGEAVNVGKSVNYVAHIGFEIFDLYPNLAEGESGKSGCLGGTRRRLE